MNVHFCTPPPAQRVGGLDAAIDGLRAALVRAGATVDEALPDIAEGEHIVHFHGLWQLGCVRQAKRCGALGMPYVVSPHGMLEPWAMRHKWWKKWPYFFLVEKHFLSRADGLLATGCLESERLKKLIPGQRIESLPLGMTGTAQPNYAAARAQLGWSRDERVLLFLSRLHVKKGLELLLRALAKVDRRESARLVIVGGGEADYVHSVHKLAGELGDALPRVDWIGEVWGEDRWPYFQGADLFCLPTFSENFGLAVLDACQVGTPVLTTSATPWVEHLDSGRGTICEPREDSVREALVRILNEPRRTPEARNALSEWAWSTFHWDALAPRYLACYAQAISLSPARRRLHQSP